MTGPTFIVSSVGEFTGSMRNELKTIPIACGSHRDMAPRRVWRQVKHVALQNARLAGIGRAEWERRRIEYGSARGADLAMARLPTYDGARCHIDARGHGDGHILDGLTCAA